MIIPLNDDIFSHFVYIIEKIISEKFVMGKCF